MAGEKMQGFGVFSKLFYLPSPYAISGTPPALPFKSHPYLPEPKVPGSASAYPTRRPLPPSAQWR